jgi:hypothetical protein
MSRTHAPGCNSGSGSIIWRSCGGAGKLGLMVSAAAMLDGCAKASHAMACRAQAWPHCGCWEGGMEGWQGGKEESGTVFPSKAIAARIFHHTVAAPSGWKAGKERK